MIACIKIDYETVGNSDIQIHAKLIWEFMICVQQNRGFSPKNKSFGRNFQNS